MNDETRGVPIKAPPAQWELGAALEPDCYAVPLYWIRHGKRMEVALILDPAAATEILRRLEGR